MTESAGTPSSKTARKRKRTSELAVFDELVSQAPAKKTAKISVKEKTKKEEKNKTVEKIPKKEKEKSDILSDEIIEFLNEGKQISLESYYYGSKAGEKKTELNESDLFIVKVSFSKSGKKLFLI